MPRHTEHCINYQADVKVYELRKGLSGPGRRKKEVTRSEASNYVADDDQKKRAVRNTGHHPKAMLPPKDRQKHTKCAPNTHSKEFRMKVRL